MRNIRATEAATHVISYLLNTIAPVKYGNAVDLDPKASGGTTAGQVIKRLTGSEVYKKLYNVQIAMGKTTPLAEPVRPAMY